MDSKTASIKKFFWLILFVSFWMIWTMLWNFRLFLFIYILWILDILKYLRNKKKICAQNSIALKRGMLTGNDIVWILREQLMWETVLRDLLFPQLLMTFRLRTTFLSPHTLKLNFRILGFHKLFLSSENNRTVRCNAAFCITRQTNLRDKAINQVHWYSEKFSLIAERWSLFLNFWG